MLLRKRKKKKILILGFIIFFILLGIISIISINYVKKIKKQLEIITSSAKEFKKTFSQNDINLLRKKLNNLSLNYQKLEKESKKIFWLSFIPYIADFKNGVEAGRFILNATEKSIIAISPYADLIGLKKGESSFIEKSAEERLQTAILTLDKMLNHIDPITENIKQAEIRLEKIDPNRYPKKIGKIEIREKINLLKTEFKGISSLFIDAKPLIKKLPKILGKDEEKTYLLLFQNDKELRATGGFLTFYSFLKIKDGKIKIESSSDIYNLDNSINSHPKAPPEILTYHKGVNKFYIRDSNLSPDFPTSVKLFESLYKNSSIKKDYDGIIAMDSKILVDMLEIFGDTEAGGVRFSAKTDKRCDCPQVIYTLFDIVDRPVPYLKENRKGILGELMLNLFYKAIGFSPSKYWGTLFQTMLTNLRQKHLLLYFVDSEIQKAIEKINFAGKINQEWVDDYLCVVNVNFAGAKSNMFVSQEYYLETKGNKKELIIIYRNPYPHSDCNEERGGLCLNATLRNWLRIYVPKGSKLIKFQGSTKEVKTYTDLEKTVFEGFLTVIPKGIAKVIVQYEVPKEINTNKILVQKQAGTYNDKLTIKTNNQIIFRGILDEDKKFFIK